MTEDQQPARDKAPRLEEPLHTRKRLSTPPQPVGEPPTRFANLALGLYATFCNIVGLVFTLTGAFMSEWLGVAGWVATVFGVIVLLWSFIVTLYANRRVSRRGEVGRVLRINVGIIALGLLALVWPDSLSRDGKLMLGIWTAVVAAFTLAQGLARRDLP